MRRRVLAFSLTNYCWCWPVLCLQSSSHCVQHVKTPCWTVLVLHTHCLRLSVRSVRVVRGSYTSMQGWLDLHRPLLAGLGFFSSRRGNRAWTCRHRQLLARAQAACTKCTNYDLRVLLLHHYEYRLSPVAKISIMSPYVMCLYCTAMNNNQHCASPRALSVFSSLL